MKLSAVVEVGQEKTTWVTYVDNFEICVKYLSKTELRAMLENATDRKFDRRTNTNQETLNPRKFDKGLACVIVDWKGLTVATLGKLLPLKLNLEASTDTLVDCDEEAKLLLLEHAYGFDRFLQDTCTEIVNFEQERQQEQQKN